MASCSKSGKDNKASYKTVLKWEKQFGTKFDCDFHGKDVIRIRCRVCGKWEKQSKPFPTPSSGLELYL